MIAILSTAYLPPISYFLVIQRSEKIIIERSEGFIKQTFRNRCYIYSANGKQALVIPVNKRNDTKINDVRIDYSSGWNKIHWRSIESAYNKSPFFIYYSDYFLPFYERKFNFLIDFNDELTQLILKLLKISMSISYTDSFQRSFSDYDFRYMLSPKKEYSSLKMYLKEYPQVFAEKHNFMEDLSIIDLLFNRGNLSLDYLADCSNDIKF